MCHQLQGLTLTICCWLNSVFLLKRVSFISFISDKRLAEIEDNLLKDEFMIKLRSTFLLSVNYKHFGVHVCENELLSFLYAADVHYTEIDHNALQSESTLRANQG